MIAAFWPILGALVLMLVWLGLVMGALFGLFSGFDGDGWAGFAGAVCAVLAVVSAAWAIDQWTADGDGVHSWSGGAGPATVCVYEVDGSVIMVGRVPVEHDELRTVCRDPERPG